MKKGFTIVEIVIVIAVIAVLAAVLIPVFSNVIDKGRESSDTSQAREMTTALAIYKADHKVENLTDVIKAIKASGLLSRIQTAREGTRYVWDKSTNTVLYVSDENEVLSNSEDYGGPDNWITITYELPAEEADSPVDEFDDVFK